MGAGLKGRISVAVMGAFYILAGLNHFVFPEFYLPLIPDYLPFHGFINYASGALETLLGLGLFFTKTRKAAAYAIVGLLLLFIPSHVHFIRIGGCVPDGLCAGLAVSWLRLILIHPLLILWAVYTGRQ